MRRSVAGAVVLIVTGFWWSCKRSDDAGTSLEPVPLPVSEVTTQPPVQDVRPVIVALGDSLTAGNGVDPGEKYPAQLQRRIDAAGWKYRVVNEGMSGDTSAQGMNRLSLVRRHHPALVIVELGANDGLRGLPVEATRRNLAEIMRALRQDGAEVVLAGMQVPPNYGPEYTQAFGRIFTDLAKSYDVALVPFFLEGVGGHADLNQEDGIHPTAAGYRVVTENVWKILEPLLRRSAQKSAGQGGHGIAKRP